MTPQEFAAKIKAKYKDYAGMDDLELAKAVVSKYPDYGSQVQFGSDPPISNSAFEVAGKTTTPNPQSMTQYASFAGVPAAYRGVGFDPARALLTNEPTQGFAEDVLRGLPAAGGAAVGAVGGIPGGPLGMIAGAGLGAGAFEAGRTAVANIAAPFTGGRIARPEEVLTNVATQAVAGASGEVGGQVLLAGRKALPALMRLALPPL